MTTERQDACQKGSEDGFNSSHGARRMDEYMVGMGRAIVPVHVIVIGVVKCAAVVCSNGIALCHLLSGFRCGMECT